MDTETLAKSKMGMLFMKLLASGMESRFRYHFFSPIEILKGTDILPGQVVLEVGCGTGYFTLPAARMIGDQGSLVAMDVLSESVELVSQKVQAADLHNVRVVKEDALNTSFGSEYFDTVLLFGVIPAPMLPLNKLLLEMHRILKVKGTLAVWPPIPGWLPQAALRSKLFTYINFRKGVHNFRRC